MNEFLSNVLTEYGSPMYFFDEDAVADRIEYLRNILPDGIGICYAMKANTFLTKVAADNSDKVEVCSPGEFLIVKKLGIDYSKLVISGVNKTRDSMEIIIGEAGALPVYTAESVNHYRIISEIAKEKKIRIKLLLRLTSNNQFGMKKSDIKYIIEDAKAMQFVDIVGIHYFSGTQKHSLKIIEKEILKVNSLIDELNEEFGINMTDIEYGGGFPIHYFEEDEFDEAEFLANMNDIIVRANLSYKLTIELGRSIVADAGYYQTKIIDMKSDKFVNYCILDGGINHITYYGQSMGMKLPKITHRKSSDIDNLRQNEDVGDNLYEFDSNGLKDYVLCGSLCTVNDILVKQIGLEDAKTGDYLLFHKAGAYCVTEGISLFLSRELPGVVLFSKRRNEAILVRKITDTSMINCPNYDSCLNLN